MGSSSLLQAAQFKSVLKMSRHWLMMLLLGLAMLVWSSDGAVVTGLQRKTRQWQASSYATYDRSENPSPQQFRQDADWFHGAVGDAILTAAGTLNNGFTNVNEALYSVGEFFKEIFP
ncbi:hypothetical protein PoB_000562900 [Plakobranchus ocellatus]|uniref:Uncharacterized protein n=1 Tax=Plakobranchus ocellatus TaxID=259542 RepID=A0AAV3Y872_9GAST|nr:hypothetical protein PoB_000562900 [Plakobranchus ocellatus]